MNPLVGEVLTLSGAIAAIAWFFWMRYRSLETRFDSLESQITDVHHRAELNRQAVQSNYDHHEYLINSNTQLINHRTERLRSEMQLADTRLGKDLDEVKSFLSKTTEFVIRTEKA